MYALQRRRVDHPARVSDEQRARHRELGHRPVAAAGKRLGTPGNPLPALQNSLDQRMELELLEQVVGRGCGIAVVEVDYEADRHEVLTRLVVLHRVDPGPAELSVLWRDLHWPRLREGVNDAIQWLG